MVPVLLFLGYYLAVILPRGYAARRALVELQPAQVQRVVLRSQDLSADGKTLTTVELDRAAVEEFVRTLAASRGHFPNHPSGGWRCWVRITTREPAVEHAFTIHKSANDGVHVGLTSRDKLRWNYGTLRNDALAPLVERAFVRQTTSPAPGR